MNFNNRQAIYLQISDFVCEKILLDEWKPQTKVPSIRELAIDLEVNPNTVMRTYELLQQHNILESFRGKGLFVHPEGIKNAKAILKQKFQNEIKPVFFRNLYLLDINFESLSQEYDQFVNQQNQHS